MLAFLSAFPFWSVESPPLSFQHNRKPASVMYLNAHTFFSLRYGTFSPKQLVEAASMCPVKTLVLTDINNTSAALDFVRACKDKGIKPVLGIEFRDEQHRFLPRVVFPVQLHHH